MKRIYGREGTHLRLTGKADEFYSGTDPLTIIEHIEIDESEEKAYSYTIKEPEWNIRKPITEEQLIKWLEDMQDASEEDDD